MRGIHWICSNVDSKPLPCSTRRRLDAAGKLLSCTCANPSVSCCPASKIFEYTTPQQEGRWIQPAKCYHLVHIDNKLQTGRHCVVDWERDLCRRDYRSCWRKETDFTWLLFGVDVVHKSKGMILKITCISLSISRCQLFGSLNESSHCVGSANCYFHPIGLDNLTLGGVDGSAMHQFFGTLDTAL